MYQAVKKLSVLTLLTLTLVSPAYAVTYATFDSANKGTSITLSGGDLVANTGGSWGVARSTICVSSGKWYWEYKFTGTVFSTLNGIVTSSASLNTYVGGDANGYGYYPISGNKYNNNTPSAYGAAYTAADTIGVALDMDGGTITMYKNNVSQGTMFSSLSGCFYAGASGDVSLQTITANFGASALTYTPPSGFNSGLYSGSAAAPNTQPFFRFFKRF